MHSGVAGDDGAMWRALEREPHARYERGIIRQRPMPRHAHA